MRGNMIDKLKKIEVLAAELDYIISLPPKEALMFEYEKDEAERYNEVQLKQAEEWNV
jgi:hypothetical protein